MSAFADVKFRDSNTNLNDDAQSPLWAPANWDGSGWSVATGRASAQGGAIDKSNGVGGLTLAIAAVGIVAAVWLITRKGKA